MRVLIAGATGAIARQLVPILRADGHEVIGLARSAARASAPAVPDELVSADALDRGRVLAAARTVRPDAIVNVLTAIPLAINPRRMARDFEATNRLRRQGTANLVAAARDVGARIVSESIAFAYAPAQPGLADEDAPLWGEGCPRQFVPVLAAVRELERLTLEADGVVLRLGHLYGPGTGFAADGALTARLRTGKLPIVGSGAAAFSFVHVHDTALAIRAALARAGSTVLNVVDDEPVEARVWIREIAGMLGAKPPKRVPAALARLLVGGWGVAYMTELRGASNARLRETLDWVPSRPSWGDGMRDELARPPVSSDG